MDPKNLIEDQFSKLHPCLPVNTRIGIIGAGPSGLSAAYALAKLGYNNVTVLEKYHTVAGMCESVKIEGKSSELYVLSSKPGLLCHGLRLHKLFLQEKSMIWVVKFLLQIAPLLSFTWQKRLGLN